MNNAIFDIHEPIIEGESIGGVRLGIDYRELFSIDPDYLKKIIDITNFGHVIHVQFDGISFGIDIQSNEIESIQAILGYKGRFKGKVYIGMRKEELLESFPALKYHESSSFYFAKKTPGITFAPSAEGNIMGIAVFNIADYKGNGLW